MIDVTEIHLPRSVRDCRAKGALRIGVLAPPWFRVPPTAYGGIEQVVGSLVDGLVERGHAVTVFASGDSVTRARLRSVYAVAPSDRLGDEAVLLRHVLACYRRAGEFDVIHDHCGAAGLSLAASCPIPVVHTVHGALDGEVGEIYSGVQAVAPGSRLVSLSLSQRRARPDLDWVANCPNGIDFSRYPLKRRHGGYLAFLGRMGADKGCHRAIEVAREAGLPLRIAAKCREPLERRYFRESVRPRLGDGVEYLGEVGLAEKVALLQGARALLFPIAWEEPFGLAMIEAMACGTPVIATRRGAVPEVVDDGVTGVLVDDHHQMPAALAGVDVLDPRAIRERALERFSDVGMISRYERIYRTVLESARPGRAAVSGTWANA